MAGRGSPPGVRYGGRAKGTPNRATQTVLDKLTKLKCDPIEGLARLAMDEKQEPELRQRCYSDLAQYVYPKRKAIEHSGDASNPITFVIETVGEDEAESESGEEQQ